MNIHIFAGLGIKGLRKYLIKILEGLASENGMGWLKEYGGGETLAFVPFKFWATQTMH